jgi:two-component system sensor histidine kinase RpfC
MGSRLDTEDWCIDTQNPVNADDRQRRPHTGAENMSPNNKMILSENIRMQARLRASLGIPVCVGMLLCLWYWGTAAPEIGPWQVIPAFGLNVIYIVAMLLAVRTPSRLKPALIANLTAVMDPLMLSLGLSLMGEAGQLFTCFYLFTILGFGFRIGARTMAICQAASITGFIAMALLTPAWRQHPVAALSVLLFLMVVPFYAKSLIVGLQQACRHAESESSAKTQLLANVSHELRTPLTGIVSCAQLMREENEDLGVHRRSDTILALSRELMAQINDLLDSAKVGADALQLERAPFRITDLAEQLRRTLGATALTRGVLLHVSTDDRIAPHLLGDAFHLGRVLLNLGSNALKFTEHGEVLIRMSLLEETAAACHVRFSCRDTGTGIAPELHQKIFEPFFQASAGITRKYGGTGLGMSIVKGILTAMNSRLTIQSAPGQGSLFEFDLWLERALPPETAEPGKNEAVRNKRILVADDNATNLVLTRELLERDGHQVTTAANGREAIELLGTAPIDLAILDFNMGDIDGASVLQIHRFGTLDPVPAYILTADNAPATARRLMDTGAAGVLHKPIDLATLRQAISHVFSAGPAPRQEGLPVIQYIDQATMTDLRELGDDPLFFEQLLGTAAADIEVLCNVLSDALLRNDLGTTRNKAHALKGISVSVGAVQLSSIATRLTLIVQADLHREGAALAAEIARTAAHSISSLRHLILSPGR